MDPIEKDDLKARRKSIKPDEMRHTVAELYRELAT